MSWLSDVEALADALNDHQPGLLRRSRPAACDVREKVPCTLGGQVTIRDCAERWRDGTDACLATGCEAGKERSWWLACATGELTETAMVYPTGEEDLDEEPEPARQPARSRWQRCSVQGCTLGAVKHGAGRCSLHREG